MGSSQSRCARGRSRSQRTLRRHYKLGEIAAPRNPLAPSDRIVVVGPSTPNFAWKPCSARKLSARNSGGPLADHRCSSPPRIAKKDRQNFTRDDAMAIYAASRINQLRKSSSAASQPCKTNKIKNLHFGVVCQPSKLSILSALQLPSPHWTMSATS